MREFWLKQKVYEILSPPTPRPVGDKINQRNFLCSREHSIDDSLVGLESFNDLNKPPIESV